MTITPRFVVGRGRWRGVAVGLAGILAVTLFGTALLRPATATQTTAAAPSFALPLLTGDGRLALGALRGHPVLLNFWASYCDACKQEMPTLEAAYRRYRARGVTMVGVDTLGDVPAEARALVRRMGLTYPMVLDARQDVADQYNIAGLPTSVFIDAAGRVRGTVVGVIDDATLRCGWGLSNAASCAQTRLVAPAAGTSGTGPGSTQPDIAWPSGKWRAPAFALTNQRGQRVSLTGLRGHIVALDFLSVTCRGQCPVEGRQLARVETLLGAQRAGVDFITVSVEPESDSRQATVAFGRSAGLDRQWQYLTGTRRALTPVWRSYYVAAAPPPVKGHPDADPIHSLGLYVIDQRGDVRAYFDAPTSGRVAAAIGALLP